MSFEEFWKGFSADTFTMFASILIAIVTLVFPVGFWIVDWLTDRQAEKNKKANKGL